MAQDTDGAQRHVYADCRRNQRRQTQSLDQLADLDASYPGGLSITLQSQSTLTQSLHKVSTLPTF
jgi:hypothetical protein